MPVTGPLSSLLLQLLLASSAVLGSSLGVTSASTASTAADSIFTTTTTNLANQAEKMGRLAQTHHTRLLQDGGPLETVCNIIESQFDEQVDCTCSGSPFTAFNLNCEYVNTICSPDGKTCGSPVIALSLADGGVFSAAACVTNYQRDGVAFGDTCISVDLCEDSDGFCDCTVTYDDQICNSCTVCGEGKGLALDCTNANAEAVTRTCQPINFDLDLGGGGSIAGFLPTFEGLCSNLENDIDGRIGCNCLDSGGGTFDITCETKQELCGNNVCGGVKSNVEVVDNEIQTVTACVDFSAPNDLKELCTKVEVCEDDKSAICGCTAIYDGTACASCEVCDGGNAVRLDCSNIREDIVINTCQAVTASTSFEFIPDFDNIAPSALQGDDSSAVSVSFGKASTVAGLVGAVLAVASF